MVSSCPHTPSPAPISLSESWSPCSAWKVPHNPWCLSFTRSSHLICYPPSQSFQHATFEVPGTCKGLLLCLGDLCLAVCSSGTALTPESPGAGFPTPCRSSQATLSKIVNLHHFARTAVFIFLLRSYPADLLVYFCLAPPVRCQSPKAGLSVSSVHWGLGLRQAQEH